MNFPPSAEEKENIIANLRLKIRAIKRDCPTARGKAYSDIKGYYAHFGDKDLFKLCYENDLLDLSIEEVPL
uniref:Uncharacterized protein n=1 Tax=viral metagenome TaxID=1070528 RepID=A0A6M3JUD8_9ZZZZ